MWIFAFMLQTTSVPVVMNVRYYITADQIVSILKADKEMSTLKAQKIDEKTVRIKSGDYFYDINLIECQPDACRKIAIAATYDKRGALDIYSKALVYNKQQYQTKVVFGAENQYSLISTLSVSLLPDASINSFVKSFLSDREQWFQLLRAPRTEAPKPDANH